INGGLAKLLKYMPTPTDLPEAVVKDNAAMAEIVWLMPLISCAEILGGLLIIIPKTRALGALIVFPVMVGVLLHHIFVDPKNIVMALIIWIVLIAIIINNKEKYLPIIK
ncbi:MAG: DoxX family protein, partial [Chitinophagia bacterium]|nr:DoxX family protein [Chitinophagia bacterium]